MPPHDLPGAEYYQPIPVDASQFDGIVLGDGPAAHHGTYQQEANHGATGADQQARPQSGEEAPTGDPTGAEYAARMAAEALLGFAGVAERERVKAEQETAAAKLRAAQQAARADAADKARADVEKARQDAVNQAAAADQAAATRLKQEADARALAEGQVAAYKAAEDKRKADEDAQQAAVLKAEADRRARAAETPQDKAEQDAADIIAAAAFRAYNSTVVNVRDMASALGLSPRSPQEMDAIASPNVRTLITEEERQKQKLTWAVLQELIRRRVITSQDPETDRLILSSEHDSDVAYRFDGHQEGLQRREYPINGADSAQVARDKHVNGFRNKRPSDAFLEAFDEAANNPGSPDTTKRGVVYGYKKDQVLTLNGKGGLQNDAIRDYRAQKKVVEIHESDEKIEKRKQDAAVLNVYDGVRAELGQKTFPWANVNWFSLRKGTTMDRLGAQAADDLEDAWGPDYKVKLRDRLAAVETDMDLEDRLRSRLEFVTDDRRIDLKDPQKYDAAKAYYKKTIEDEWNDPDISDERRDELTIRLAEFPHLDARYDAAHRPMSVADKHKAVRVLIARTLEEQLDAMHEEYDYLQGKDPYERLAAQLMLSVKALNKSGKNSEKAATRKAMEASNRGNLKANLQTVDQEWVRDALIDAFHRLEKKPRHRTS